MSTKFTNNASSKLTQALTADATSMHIQAEDVSKFPVLGAEDFCRLTIVGDHGDHEIVKVTSISSDGTCAIERAQESTTAKEWPIENKVELRITAEYLNSITTSEDVLSLVSPIEEDISNLEQSIADTSSSLTDLITSVEEKAAKSYVKKTGDTMTGSLLVKAPNPVIAEFNTNITKGTTPSSNCVSQIKYADKDGTLTGAVLNVYTSEGSIKSALIAVDPSSTNTSEISVMWKDGAACGYAPSPTINATSSEITTASWVNAKLSKYLPLTGGSLTGNLAFIVNSKIASYIYNDEESSIMGAYSDTGWEGSVILRNKLYEANPSGIELITGSSFNGPKLLLFKNGILSWNNKNIVRSVGGVNADDTGNVNAPYLPLTGGNITGAINVKDTGNLGATNGYIYLAAATDNVENGAFLTLRTKETGGSFNLSARQDSSVHSLTGEINGALRWDNKHIVRSVGGVNADAAGNVNAPYLSLSGGILNNGSNFAVREDRTQIISSNGGGYLTLFKSNHSSQPGAAELVARNESNAAVHAIKATRTGCFADGVNIVRSINGVKAAANGNVSLNIAGVKVNNAVYADSAGSAGSVATCAYMASQYISSPNTPQTTIRITTPNWGNFWYVLGHSTLGGGNNNAVKTYTVSSIYGPNTNVVNENVALGQSNPNYHWTYSGIVCIRIS